MRVLAGSAKPKRFCKEAFEFDKDNPDASFWLADVRQKQGRFDDAVEIMERSVSSMERPELARLCFLERRARRR